MDRKLIAAALSAVLLLTLCACGAVSPAPAPAETPAADPVPAVETPVITPEPTEAPTPEPPPAPVWTYDAAYLQYMAVFGALTDEVERRIEIHNAVLESQYPDSYYMNSSYLMQSCLPFRPAYPALGSALSGDTTESTAEALRSHYPDAVLNVIAPGAYEAAYTYSYTDRVTGEEIVRPVRCVWECDRDTGAFRVRAWEDGTMAEFTEFVPQGDGRYLIYTMTDKILVGYQEGEITSLAYAHRISEPPLGTFPGDMRLCSLDQADFYPDAVAEENWIREDGDAQYLLTLDGGDLVYAGQIAQDVLDARGDKVGVSWLSIEPIRLFK